jgi:farnesyl-diphosphate farnesyltransferase
MTASVETPSGKNAGGENFPVGSFLIRADLRPHVQAFYRFARAADDIADNSDLAPEEKVRRLDLMEAVLTGKASAGSPAAAAMRADLQATGIDPRNCLDLLVAFRWDATRLRYANWGELLEYCRYSAAPVGRQVLDLHRAPAAAYAPSDALCAALQVINHLQDCGEDFRALDRVYVPLDDMAACGAGPEELGEARSSPGLRHTYDRMLTRVEAMLAEAHGLPANAGNARLRAETMVIVTLAERLTRMLRRQDPLARRVKLGKAGFLLTCMEGVWRSLTIRSGKLSGRTA